MMESKILIVEDDEGLAALTKEYLEGFGFHEDVEENGSTAIHRIIEEQPDFALLLSWHLSDSIISKIKNDGYKGKIIVPLPEPKII